MRKSLITIVAALSCTLASAQIHTTKPAIDYTLTDDLAWILRYDKDVEAIRNRDKSVTDFTCDGLFVGSSSITFWDTLAEDFPDMRVVNRGYGGATIRDILYNYASIFGKYQPKNIVFYCDNDISGDRKHDVTMGEWYDLYRTFFQKVHADYPDAKIYALSIKYSGTRVRLRDTQRIMNTLLEEFCRNNDWITYVDVTTPLLLPDGTPDNRLYQKDQLHITREGYTLWTNQIRKAGLSK